MQPELTVAALRLAQRTPRSWLDALASAGSRRLGQHPSAALRQWQHNIEIITGEFPDAELTAQATASWARNAIESMQLATWRPEEILAEVAVTDVERDRLLEAHQGSGAVLALPHLGSWDLAGAWACQLGMPVTSVAEALAPAEFEFFQRARAGVGMNIYSHRDPAVFTKLVADQRCGRMVCLLADRNFSKGGIAVNWPTASGRREVRVPAGPARLAVETGATMLAVTTYYEPDVIDADGTRRRGKMRLNVSDPISAPAGPGQVRSMCQQMVDVFAREVTAHPADWHVLQPFFPDADPVLRR